MLIPYIHNVKQCRYALDTSFVKYIHLTDKLDYDKKDRVVVHNTRQDDISTYTLIDILEVGNPMGDPPTPSKVRVYTPGNGEVYIGYLWHPLEDCLQITQEKLLFDGRYNADQVT